jgi:hypothetical protein
MLMILVTMVLGDWRWYGVPMDSDHQNSQPQQQQSTTNSPVKTRESSLSELEGKQKRSKKESKGMK